MTKLKLEPIYRLLLGGISILLSACTTPERILATDLRPFVSDECSYFFEGTPGTPKKWAACCVSHDRAYWAGGVASARALSDEQFKQCVIESGGGKALANSMWLGVRIGGAPWYPSRFRWGFGWPYYRGYKAITPAEQLEIDKKSAL